MRLLILLFALISECASGQFTIKPMPAGNRWEYSLASLEVTYWSVWRERLTFDTLKLRPTQFVLDSLEGGFFMVKLDTIVGRGSTRRSFFSTLWMKGVTFRRDTFDLPNIPYGLADCRGIVLSPADSLHRGTIHTFVADTLATEQLIIEPLLITTNNAQVWLRAAHTHVPRLRYRDSTVVR